MKKTFSIILITLSAISLSNAHEPFKRKEVKPSFFMPELKSYQEDLSPKPQISGQAGFVNAPSQEAVYYNTQVKEIKQDLIKQNDYTKIYDEYIKDIQHISKTKQYPSVEKIKKDFTGMNTNDKFLVP